MPKLLKIWLPEGWYFWKCDNTELKRSSTFFPNGIAGLSGLTRLYFSTWVKLCLPRKILSSLTHRMTTANHSQDIMCPRQQVCRPDFKSLNGLKMGIGKFSGQHPITASKQCPIMLAGRCPSHSGFTARWRQVAPSGTKWLCSAEAPPAAVIRIFTRRSVDELLTCDNMMDTSHCCPPWFQNCYTPRTSNVTK